MIRFLEKKTFRQAIISIKALGFPALLFILLMFLPCQAFSKQAAILDAIIDGETKLSLQFIENQQSELLSKYFQLLQLTNFVCYYLTDVFFLKRLWMEEFLLKYQQFLKIR